MKVCFLLVALFEVLCWLWVGCFLESCVLKAGPLLGWLAGILQVVLHLLIAGGFSAICLLLVAEANDFALQCLHNHQRSIIEYWRVQSNSTRLVRS